MRAVLRGRRIIPFLLWNLVVVGAKSIRDLSHGLEGLRDEGDGGEIWWDSSKLGRKVSEVIGGWLQAGTRGTTTSDIESSERSVEKQRESPVSWWQGMSSTNKGNVLHSNGIHRRKAEKQTTTILLTFLEVVTLFDQYYPHVTQHAWNMNEDAVKKVFLKILQDISKSGQRNGAIVKQIINQDLALYNKPIEELGIDPNLKKRYNFLIQEMLDAKRASKVKKPFDFEEKANKDQQGKKDFDKDMLNNMKAMYAKPWGRPRVSGNSHVYPQMYNLSYDTQWKYKNKVVPTIDLEAKTERSLANHTEDMVTEESSPTELMVFASSIAPQLSRSGPLDTSIAEKVNEEEEMVKVVREHGLNMEKLQLEPPPLINSLVSPFLVREGWQNTQLGNPEMMAGFLHEEENERLLVKDAWEETKVSKPDIDILVTTPDTLSAGNENQEESIAYILGLSPGPTLKSQASVVQNKFDSMLKQEGTETMLVMLPESSTASKDETENETFTEETSTEDTISDSKLDISKENHTILDILEELILAKYNEMKDEESEEFRDMSMKKLIHLLHLLLLLKNKEGGMESFEQSWEGPETGLEDDKLHKLKIVANPQIIPPSTKYGVLVRNAITRPLAESSHLLEDSLHRDAEFVHQDISSSLSFPRDDALTGISNDGGSSDNDVPLSVASLPPLVRSQLASWGYPAPAPSTKHQYPAPAPEHHRDREQEDYQEDISHLRDYLSPPAEDPAWFSPQMSPSDTQRKEIPKYETQILNLIENTTPQNGIMTKHDNYFETNMASADRMPFHKEKMLTKKKEEIGPKLIFVNVWQSVAGVPVLTGQKVLLKWPDEEERRPRSSF